VIEIRGGREVWKKRVGVERERSPMKNPQLDAGLDVFVLQHICQMEYAFPLYVKLFFY
jgi:hypothetical protein